MSKWDRLTTKDNNEEIIAVCKYEECEINEESCPMCDVECNVFNDLAKKVYVHEATISACWELLEECAEEIENCYGKDTPLTIRIRDFLK